MTVNVSNWTGDDIAIWWEISRRFDVDGVKRFALLSHSEQSDRRDAELMHLMTHKKRECARCNVFGFRIEWLCENGLLGRFA